MRSSPKRSWLLGAALLALPASAGVAETVSYVDLTGGLGYSSNPLLVVGDDTDSAFGRVSAYGFHGITSPTGTTSLSAYVENSSYFHRYDNRQAFNLAADTRQQVNERLTVYGNVGFSGDFGAQLSSRFYGVPAGSVPVEPAVPTSLVLVDPDLYALTQRQYRLSGQVGLSTELSARDNLTASAGVQRVFLGGDRDDLDYNQYDGSLGYERVLSERVSVGGRVIVQYADYSLGRSITSIGPQATLRAKLSENWDVTAAAGLVSTREDLGSLGGEDTSIDLALDLSACRNGASDRFCGRLARRTESSIIGGAPTTTTAAVDYYRRLSAKDTVQFNAAISHSDDSAIETSDQRSTFTTIAGSLDHAFTPRLAAGVNLSARKLAVSGDDPKADIGGSVFVRFRLGDVR